MNRRDFLISVSGMLGAYAVSSSALAASTSSQLSIDLRVDLRHVAGVVPRDFVGLSYESAELGNPSFFSAANRDLVALFRRLSTAGVLRIGGNSREYADWSVESRRAFPSSDLGKESRGRTVIRPDAIYNLAAFCDATGWRIVYGLNLGTGTPDQAADEASFVWKALGPRLIAFQVGNEPDLFNENGLRPTAWSFYDYLSEWTRFAAAIVSRVPDARFGGPDVSWKPDWLELFAAAVPQLKRRKIVVSLISGHYYAEGPPESPESTIARLLDSHTAFAPSLARMVAAARSADLPYQMTEMNSCFNGGKSGVSDAFASALWGADTMLQLAQAGVAGVNFHGGGNAYYTPIAGSVAEGFSVRPLYYGILAASQFVGKRMVAVTFQANAVNAVAYAATSGSQFCVAVINKDPQTGISVGLGRNGEMKEPTVWRLAGPSPQDTLDTTLAGCAVDRHGAWRPHPSPEIMEIIPFGDFLDVPAGGAALLFSQLVGGR